MPLLLKWKTTSTDEKGDERFREMPSEHDGDDWSLSDLSISEPDLECDDETETPVNEPSSWAEVRA